MLTPHNLFLSLKWGGFLLANGVAGKVPGHLPSWFTCSTLPEVLGSINRCWLEITICLYHSLLGHRKLMLTKPHSPFVPLFTWVYHILSYPRLGWRLPAFLEDLLPEAGGSCAIWPHILLTSLDFLRYHDFHTSLGQTFLIPHFLRHKTYFSSSYRLGSPFFILRAKPSSFSHFRELDLSCFYEPSSFLHFGPQQHYG